MMCALVIVYFVHFHAFYVLYCTLLSDHGKNAFPNLAYCLCSTKSR